MRLWRRRKDDRAPAPDLRGRMFRLTPSELELRPTAERPNVWAALMETGYPEAVASLVCVTDGSTSLYFSNGGGIIGAGEHPEVRAVALDWLLSIESFLPQFEPAAETPLPAIGRVRFYVRTFAATLAAEAAEEDLGHGRHVLSPLFHQAHAVITAVRRATERSRSPGDATG